MGADIHFVVEMRPRKSDHWIGVFTTDWEIDEIGFQNRERLKQLHRMGARDYPFFGRLAGVRTIGPQPNGFPDDVSTMTKYLVGKWGGDAHSHGWLTLEEFCIRWLKSSADNPRIREVVTEVLHTGKFDLSKFLGLTLQMGHPDDDDLPHQYRVCFWFDN